MAISYIALGSNLGDRAHQLNAACNLFISLDVGLILRRSPLYETEPFIYVKEDRHQPWFLNEVIELETNYSPLALFHLCKEIEQRLGGGMSSRLEDGKRRYSPRLIDVDLLLYGDVIFENNVCTIPHPRFHMRLYDLVPLEALAPDRVHPIFQKTIARLRAECKDNSTYKSYEITF